MNDRRGRREKGKKTKEKEENKEERGLVKKRRLAASSDKVLSLIRIMNFLLC